MVNKIYTAIVLSLLWTLLLCLFSCSNAEFRDHVKLKQLIYKIDSVGIVEYKQPIELRQEALGAIKSFLAAYPNSSYADSLSVLHELYTDEVKWLTDEQIAFTNLQDQVNAANTVTLVEQCRKTFSQFEVSFPKTPMRSELDDISLILSFVMNTESISPDSITELNDLNSHIHQSNNLLGKLKGETYHSRVEHRIRLLESRRQIACENEIKVQSSMMEDEMEGYATSMFHSQCTCLKLPGIFKKFVGLKSSPPKLKNSKREDETDEIKLYQTYEYLGPGGTLCSESRLFTIEAIGTLTANCEEGVSYNISASMPNPPIIK